MTKLCKVKDCNNPNPIRIIKGLCNKHYLRFVRYGDVNRGRLPQSKETQEKRSKSLKKYFSEHPESREKQRESMKKIRHAGNFKKGYAPWNKGKDWVERRGENHHNWKGGVSKQEKLERVKFRQTIQLLVFERDNYTCQVCSQYSGYLQVDHIKPWAKYPELRFELDNCRTLCMACHYYVTFKRKMPEGTIWGHTLSRRIS